MSFLPFLAQNSLNQVCPVAAANHFQILFCEARFSQLFNQNRNLGAVLHALQTGVILIAVALHGIGIQEFKEVKAEAQMFYTNLICDIGSMVYQMVNILLRLVVADKITEGIQPNQTLVSLIALS